MYAAQLIASAHSLGANYFDCSIQLAISFKDRFFLSPTPFCCGVYDTVCCSCILASIQSCCTYLLTYSPPLSVRSILILLPNSFSTSSLNSIRHSNTSDFNFKKNTQVKREKSSMKVSTYQDLLIEGCGNGPMMSL
jgi:hypothetical protein